MFNPAPVDPTQAVQDQLIAEANEQLGPTQRKADLGLYTPDRSFGTAFEYGGLRSRGSVLGYTADLEGRLRETGLSKFLQSTQNASLPVVNPIRNALGLAPLPEDANTLASKASEADKRNRSERLIAQAEALGFKPMTTDEIEGFRDFWTWASTTVASSGEPMLVALATGGWMSPVLMAGEYNEALKEIEGLSEDKRLALATGGGLLAGFLENIGLGLIVKGMPKELVGKLGGKYFADFISKNYGTRIGSAVLTGMTAEGLTEAGQEGIGISLESIAGKDFREGEVGKRLWEALAAGGVMGGPLRGGVQTGTEISTALQPDPLLTETDVRTAQLAALQLQSPDNAQMALAPEGQSVSMLEILNEPVSAAEPTTQVAPPATEVAAVEPTPEPVAAPAVEPAEPTVEPEPEVNIAAAIERLRQDPDVSPQPAPAVEPVAAKPAPAAEQVFTSKTVPQMIGGQPSTDPRETLTAISDGTNTRYITHVDDEGWVEVDEAGTELEKQPSFWMDGAGQKKQAIEFMQEEMAAPAVETAPAVQPAAEPAPAAEPDNPQAKPVIPFARPVSDAEGQQKTLTIRTPNSEQEVAVKPFIIELKDLKQAKGIFQPRDRSRKESDVGVRDRAKKLDPKQLMESPVTSFGAPIIARDGTIISGNGRVLSLELAKNEYPDQYANYKQAIESYGNSDQNYETPILVMMLDQDMTSQELSRFADISNAPSQAAFSVTEAASKDAKNIGVDIFDLYRPDSALESMANQEFVNMFIERAVTESERGSMTSEGLLTKPGMDRINAAILASAYNDTSILATFLEDTKNKVKSIGDAYLAAAPKLAILKSKIQNGQIAPEFDVTKFMVEAAQVIAKSRKDGKPLIDIVNQQAMFGSVEMAPETQALVRAFYTEGFGSAKHKKEITELLEFFSQEAQNMAAQDAGMFIESTTPTGLIEESSRRARAEAETRARTRGKKDDPDQGKLLQEADGTGKRPKPSGEQIQKPRVQRSGQGLKEADTASIKARLDDSERTRRAEVASEETVGATENTVVAISELDSIQTQKRGTLVYRESMREGSARYMQAFQDLGLDYNEATSLPIENQFRLLSQAMVKKFGFAAVVKTDNANAKEAVDQLLVGYHNMNDMAYRLGLPPEAIGLEGTLSYVLAKNIGAYGVYDPNTRSIALPKRSNSFAHEWFHALDHYLLDKYGSGLAPEVPLVSAAVRAHGTEAFGPDAPTGVKDSYYALMRALFKDKATEAMQLKAINQKMSEMEARAAKAGKAVSEIKSYQQLQNQKDNILASIGKSKRVLKTDYRTNSEFFNALEGRKKEYYGTPAEMAARAFESYVIRQLVSEGLATEGMGKSQAAYDMSFEQLGVGKEELADGLASYAQMADSRLALTFPKGQEQVEIFGAFTNLMDALRLETDLGKGEAASPTSTENIIDRRAMLNVPEKEKAGFLAEQKKAKREAKLETARIEKRIDQYGNRYKGFKKAVVMVEDAVLSPALYQKQTTIRSLIKRYPANTALRRIYENLGTHTGGVYQSTVEGDNLANAEARQIRFFSAMLKGIFEKYDIKSMDDAELNMLRMVLTGQDTLGGAPDRVVKAAGEIRDMYNQLYDYMNSAGMEIGYARSGYIPRMLDLPNVFADETKFKSQADKVYRIVWDEELGDSPNFSSPDMMFDTIKFIQTAKLSISELTVDKKRKSLGNSDTYRGFVKSELWQEVVDANKSLKGLLEKQKNDPGSVKDSEIDEARQRLQDAADFIAPEFESFFNDMRTMFADYRAKNWLEAIQDKQSVDPAEASPQAVFSKKRALPPEADTLLEDFYYQNPVDSLTSYMMAAVRKAEYNRRFGKQNMPDVANKTNYTDYLDYLIDKSAADSANGGFPDGVRISTAEVKMLRLTVETILGRNDSMQIGMGVKAVNRATALLSMTLLIRAPISSIAEPFTVAITSGSAVKGLHSFGMVMQELPGLRKLGKNAAEDIRLRHQFARIMGVIDDPSVSDIIMSRIGGEFNGDENLQRFLSSFFQKIQLTGITNAQRRTAARIGFQFMTEMAYEIRNPSSARNAKRAQLTLNDLGVADSRMDQFVDYLLSLNNMTDKGKVDGKIKLPAIDQVTDENATYTDMGLQLAVSVMRFTDQSIQDPRRADRPRWAENPVGKFVYGITSFIRSFHDKVLMGSIRRVQREARISRELGASKSRARADATAYAIAKVAGPMLTFFAAHALVATAREYLLNQDRWDREWEESDEDAVKFVSGYLLQNAFSRSGLTGAFDPLWQAWTGIKYQRDLSNILIGTAGYITQELDNIAGYFSDKNSDNTVSAEFKAYRALWNLTAQPMISYTFAKTPMADAIKLPAYGLAATATSTTVKNYLINEIVHLLHGQRYEPGQRGRTRKKRPGDK